MSSRYSYLSKNVFLFTISSFGPKILAFVLVPLYTNCLSTADYGVGDIITTTASLTLPIISLCISSAVLRFCFDEDKNPKKVLSNSLFIFIKGIIITLIIGIVFVLQPYINVNPFYIVSVILIILSNGLYDILTNYSRGTDRVQVMVEMSLITTGSSCFLNILLLLVFKIGLEGFLIANYAGTFLAVVWGAVRLKIWKDISHQYIDRNVKSELIHYSIPLIFNKIGWWINSSSDRYIVTWLLGSAANGIYTVSYKIPTMLTACSDVFAQAWQLSAIKEFDKNDKDGFVLEMYNLYNAFLVICCATLIVMNVPFASILYAKDFFVAWRYVPPLLISFVFGGLSGFLGSIFIAVKDTKIFTISTLLGGLINIALNFLLVTTMQSAMGAALATLVSNIVIWGIRFFATRRYIVIRIPILKHFLMYLFLIIESFISLQGFSFKTLCFEILIVLLIIFVNYKEVLTLANAIIKRIRKRDDSNE